MSFNLAQYVLSEGRQRPDHPALIVPGLVQWSHAELLARVETCTGALQALGLPRGARVMLRIGNEPAFPVAYLGALAAGLVPVPTSAQLTEAEITPMAERVGATLAIGGGTVALPQGTPVMNPDDLTGPALPFDAWDQGDPDRLGYIVFTSGSGGAPKAVAHAHRAILGRRMMYAGWYGLTCDDRMMHAGAFNWTYTLGTGLLDPWTLGATAIIPAQGTDLLDLPSVIAAEKATIFAAAPGVYRRILRQTWPATPHLRHGLSAGERLPPATRSAWREITGTDLHEAFGMSECSTFVSGSPDRPAPDGAAGYAQPGRTLRVDGDRLQIRTDDPGLMLGYWENGAPTAPKGCWFDTGDRVRMLHDGAIVHEGRQDDLLNPGGYRVSPQEVEEALSGLNVSDLAVGVVEVAGGATVLACYYVGPELDEAQAQAQAAKRLARYKQPRLWLRRPSLPRNANGKLIRKALA